MSEKASKLTITDEDSMRANLYGLLGNVLFTPPSTEVLKDLSVLSGDETEMGNAFNNLSKIATSLDRNAALDEYNDLFVGMGRGELLPYCSYYLTGFLNEKPLAKVRNTMRELGIEKNTEIKEPEDHIGSLFEMMSGLIVGRYGEPANIQTQQAFYSSHIEPWAGHFFKDLEAAKSSRLYQPVGTIGRLFIEIETNAYSME